MEADQQAADLYTCKSKVVPVITNHHFHTSIRIYTKCTLDALHRQKNNYPRQKNRTPFPNQLL